MDLPKKSSSTSVGETSSQGFVVTSQTQDETLFESEIETNQDHMDDGHLTVIVHSQTETTFIQVIKSDNNDNLSPQVDFDSEAKDKIYKKRKLHWSSQRIPDYLHFSGSAHQFISFTRMTVMNLFHDLSRMFGFGKPQKPPKKIIHFPEEVIDMAEQKGEVAGKDRVVPLKEQPYRRPVRKKKVVESFSDGEFNPKIPVEDSVSKCERNCEKWLMTCSCLRKRKVREGNQSFQLSPITEGLLYDLNEAGKYLLGHKALTYNSALESVDLPVPKPEENENVSESNSIRGIEDLPIIPVSTAHIGMLATNVWIFAYCLPYIFDAEDLPNESGFWRLMEQFTALAKTVYDGHPKLMEHSKHFYNYAAECKRVIEILQIKIDFEGEFSFTQPIKCGDGLELSMGLNKTKINSKQKINVMVTRKSTTHLEWSDFKNLNSHDKISFLKHLLYITMEGYIHAQTQLRMLLDDIIESAKDKTVFDQDILYLLVDIYNRINSLESQLDSPRKKKEIALVEFHMSIFTKSFHNFVQTGQHIMRKLMELRDMLQLTCTYLEDEFHLNLLKFIPDEIVKKWEIPRCCCCVKPKCCRKSKPDYIPEYSKWDFYRVFYEEALTCQSIPADTYCFQLMKSTDKNSNITFGKPPEIRFSKSDPNIARTSWGSYGSDRSLSLEFLLSSPKASEMIEPILKPILRNVESLEFPLEQENLEITGSQQPIKASSIASIHPPEPAPPEQSTSPTTEEENIRKST